MAHSWPREVYAEAQKLGVSAREAAERLEQRGIDLAQKKLDLARAENNEQKARVGILQEQQDKLKEASRVAKGNAEQFGSYDETKQQAVSTALQSYMQNGRKGITQDQHDLLSSTNITREFVAEKGGSVATNGDEYRKIMALTKQKDAAFLDQEAAKVGQEKMTVQSKIDVKFQVDEEKMQKDMTKVFTEVMTKLLTLMKASENNTAKMKQGAASSEKSQ